MHVEEYDRYAAYAAARSALEAIHRTTGAWPAEVADTARRAAAAVVSAISEALGYAPTSPGRRRCLRGALANALELAAICDIARGHGLGDDESLRCAGRTLSLLGLSYQATAAAE